jgi:tocopherol O-methyltransferase
MFNSDPRGTTHLHDQQGSNVSSVSMGQVADLYEAKTSAILRRYGPGPRVHYHTGFVDESAPLDTIAEARTALIEGQERMLTYASATWNLHKGNVGDVLDVGCGLGGTAIFLAQRFDAQVTAITIAPSHIELIADFAKRAEVGTLVSPLLCTAADVPGESCFDMAIGLESSSLFPRSSSFQCLARVLRSGGRVFVFDCFIERLKYLEPFNRHWRAQIGTVQEYAHAACEAGFRLIAKEDTSIRTASFWKTTLELMRLESKDITSDSTQRAAFDESVTTHRLMYQGLLDGGLRQMMR